MRSKARWAAIVIYASMIDVHASNSISNAFTPVDWTLITSDAVSAAERALVAPIGCVCVQGSSHSCTFFECSCICDLTAGACDPFCCCDTECTKDHIDATRRNGLCSDVHIPITSSLEYCSTDLTTGSSAAQNAHAFLADSVLCVAIDNNEVVGNYIAPSKEEEMTVSNAFLKNPKSYSFLTSTTTDPILSISLKAFYEPGDSIYVIPKSAQSTIHAPILLGTTPTTGTTMCTERNPIRFGFDIQVVECTQQLVDVEKTCTTQGGVLDTSSIAQNLWIARNPSITAASNPSSSDLIGITVMNLLELDPTTKTFIPQTTPFPSYYPQPVVNTINGIKTCQGALMGVQYVVYHNGNGQIERIIADVSIGSISVNNNAITQTFGITFQSTAIISDRSLSKGNLATYPRSGNPGYIFQRPIRAGILTSSGSESAITEMTGGLAVMGLGSCHTPSPSLAVGYGEDMVITCTLSLTALEFESLCKQDLPLMDQLQVNVTHIAAFGNADPYLPHEWLELEYDAPVKSSAVFTTTPNSNELVCDALLTSVHYEFLVASVGPVQNPQDKIVAARASHKKETWRFWTHTNDLTQTMTFYLTTTVSFLPIKSSMVEQWIPPTPPVWFSIPSDVFYPFLMNNSPTLSSVPIWISFLLLYFL